MSDARREPVAVVPAICDNPRCRAPFPSGIVLGADASYVQIWGARARPCPRCGSVGSVPDGLYSFGDLACQAAAQSSPEELERVEEAVQALPEDPTPDQAAEAVAKGGGRWSALASRLKALPHRDIAAYGALLLSIIRTAKGM